MRGSFQISQRGRPDPGPNTMLVKLPVRRVINSTGNPPSSSANDLIDGSGECD